MTNKQQRKKAREAVLQALYAIHLSQENEEKVLRDINERYNFDSATKEFIDELFRNTINDHTSQILLVTCSHLLMVS